MTQDERYEVVKLVAVGLGRKLTKPERRRLAILAGYYMQEKKGPPPKDKRLLPRICEANFRTPAAFKDLAEKILGKPIWVTPSWKEGYPAGQRRSKAVATRQEEYATRYLNGERLGDMACEIARQNGDETAEGLRSAYNALSRDIMSALPKVSFERTGQQSKTISDIAAGMAAIYKRKQHLPE